MKRFELLADWIDGRLSPREAVAVEAMQEEAPELRAAATWLRKFKRAAGELPLEDPPPIVGQRLRQYFDRRYAGFGVPTPLPELQAEMVSDSRRDLAVAGLRAVGAIDQNIQLAYRSSRADLVVDIHRLGRGRNRVDGQLLPTDPEAARVAEVIAAGAGTSFTALDGDVLGRFCLADVPDGRYELRASNGEFIVIAEVAIEPDPTTAPPGPEPS